MAPAAAAARGDAAALVRLAKAWARTAGLADAASAGLNSFSITLLALFHMQMTGEIGPLRDLTGLRGADAEAGEREGGGEASARSEKPFPPPPPPLLEIAPELLREEALVVWREYAARSDNVHY